MCQCPVAFDRPFFMPSYVLVKMSMENRELFAMIARYSTDVNVHGNWGSVGDDSQIRY